MRATVVVLLTLSWVLLAGHVWADPSPYECNLQGNITGDVLACPNVSDPKGTYTTTAALLTDGLCDSGTYCAVRSDPGQAIIPINAWGLCRWVDNSGLNDGNHSIFVPFKTGGANTVQEWQKFLSNTPYYINPVHCALPYSVSNSSSSYVVSPPYSDCPGATTGVTFNAPNDYGRTGASLYPYPAINQSFSCNNGATSVNAHLQWIAGDADTVGAGVSSWLPNNSFSPDLLFTAKDNTSGVGAATSITANAGDQITLSWVTPSGGVKTVVATGGLPGDGWSASSRPANGTFIVKATLGSTTYLLTVTGTNGLVSTAKVSINDTGVCGSDNGQTLSSTPTNLCSVDSIASAISGSGPWSWSCIPVDGGQAKGCMANITPINGVCGSTVNGQSLSSAPSGGELCNSGTATAVTGSGSSSSPWTWTCQGANGGTVSPSCTANLTAPACPAANSWSSTSDPSSWPLSGNGLLVAYPGITGTIEIPHTSLSASLYVYAASFFNGTCSALYNPLATTAFTITTWGNTQSESSLLTDYSPNSNLVDPLYYAWVQCIATVYAQQNLPGYANCSPASPISGDTFSPLKVNLVGDDAKLNSTTPTSFYLTLQDGRTLEGHVTGGLNADEGWLMVRRSADPLVFSNGALNANDWFGDRDRRSLNGYTDLAETFSTFIQKDEFGQRFLPLHILSADVRKAKLAADKTRTDFASTDPSVDLRVIDANGDEHLASDYFDRVYVDYRSVVEGDGPDGKSGKNLVLERGIVHTISGENHGAIDQWFLLDIPTDPKDPGHPTASKVWKEQPTKP